jgi:electron transport complex protein RnfG
VLGKSIQRNSILLGLFAMLVASGTAVTHLATKDAIAEQKRLARQKALLEIIPPARHDNSMLDDTLPTDDPVFLKLRDEQSIFIARKGNKPVAAILPAIAPDGYSGDIQLIVGINIDGSVAGVRVLSHRETPGLGDKVETQKSDWIYGFEGKSLGNPVADRWKVKRDGGEFDQFTGATITPRAVTNAVYRTLLYFKENRARLSGSAPPKTASGELPPQNEGDN